ncbi:hypothetical protein GOBAR_AA10068 [Gossypium barbadense]|uniref:Uncharacterized protein n=1 Tax=Gossypium barbadense TaxID=3634 RepID=A0A2P5Y4T2_GOSBA|nr:hypothetical protein GOBAR_AA10068 [Gossypium barbadense]
MSGKRQMKEYNSDVRQSSRRFYAELRRKEDATTRDCSTLCNYFYCLDSNDYKCMIMGAAASTEKYLCKSGVGQSRSSAGIKLTIVSLAAFLGKASLKVMSLAAFWGKAPLKVMTFSGIFWKAMLKVMIFSGVFEESVAKSHNL